MLAAIGLVLLSSSPLFAQSQPAPKNPGAKEVWQVHYLGKSRIGHSRLYTRPVTIEGETFLKCEKEIHLTIKRFGQTTQLDQRFETEELPDGTLRTFTYEMKNPPALPTLASAGCRRQSAGRSNHRRRNGA